MTTAFIGDTSKTYRVRHITTYHYDGEVSSSFGRFYLMPRNFPGQRVLEATITISPTPEDRSSGIDIYGNTDGYFHVLADHRTLVVEGNSLVEVAPIDQALLNSPAALAPWELARPLGAERSAAVEFVLDLFPSQITSEVAAYAAVSFIPGRPLIEAVRELTTRIYTDFTYKSGSTTTTTTVAAVFERREGVCQDFARVAIAALRSQGLPARYVSGYLATEPPPGRERVIGADATHAWAAVGLPGDQWIAFDPTNDKLVDERHVTVAWGRDYGDVPPLRGIIYADSAKSRIEVSVDVAPVDISDKATNEEQ